MACNTENRIRDFLIEKNVVDATTQRIFKASQKSYDLIDLINKRSRDKWGFAKDIVTVEESKVSRKVNNTQTEVTQRLVNYNSDLIKQGENIDNQQLAPLSEVNYNLKAVDILSSDKAVQVFEKGKKNGWSLDKILTELQVPKDQKKIILDYKDNYVNNIFKNLEKECS